MGFVQHLYNEAYYLMINKQRGDSGIRNDQLHVLNRLRLKNKRLLDIGCGCGEVIKFLLRGSNTVTGIDFSSSAISMAYNHIGDRRGYELIEGDAINILPTLTGQYYTVFMMDCIEHIPFDEISSILKQIHRLCIRELIIMTPHFRVFDDFKKQGFYHNETASDMRLDTRGMHCTKYTRERLIELLHGHSFHTTDAIRYRRLDA